MFKYLVPILLCLFVIDIEAQTPRDDLQKYWHYRDRFLGLDGEGGFISLGLEAGQSIPVSGRYAQCDCKNDWHIIEGKCKPHKGRGKLEWGDATVFMGYYIAMLSLEYKNLKDARQKTSQIKEELYFALKAFERLDAAGEVALGMKPVLNGFFVRDDVPHNFYKNKDEKSNRRFFNEKKKRAYDCITSSWSCGGIKSCNSGAFISQDQIIALMFGFSFVKKFAADVRYSESSETFGDMVALYTKRMMDFLIENNWKIVGPNGEKVSNRWGGDCRGFNNLMAKAANYITENKYRKTYQSGSSKNMGKIIADSYNWGFGFHSNRNHGMIFNLITATGIWTPRKMAKRSRKADQLIFSLAYAVINDQKLHSSIDKKEWESLIRTAPWDGPCFGTPGCTAPEGWRSSDRWWHPHLKNGNPYGLTFEYSGIDYMLLYNLYHLYYKTELPTYRKPKQ